MWINLTLCVFAINFIEGICAIDFNIKSNSKSTFPVKRAVDGRRGSKFFEMPDDDSFDVYDAYDNEPDFSDYRNNIPGEPGLDYPSFTRIPQTTFTCEREYRGYYADEEAGCQLFHVCDGSFMVSSFLCPVGSTFSQKLLTCDWWNKVDCSATKNYYQANNQIVTSQVDDDEILRKAYEMTSLQSIRNGITIVNPKDQYNNDKNNNDNVNHKLSHVNELQSGRGNNYFDYQSAPTSINVDYPQFKYSSRYSSALDQHDRDIDYYPRLSDDINQSSIKVETVGRDYKNDNDEQLNIFQPSYAPTVPTVTTTTRRYYSPTIPPIIRSTQKIERKYDLQFESSDHLYSARGKHLSSGSTKNATQSTTEKVQPTLSTTTSSTLDISSEMIVTELPLTVSEEISDSTNRNENISFAIPSLVYQPPINKDNETVSRLIVEFSRLESSDYTANETAIRVDENNTNNINNLKHDKPVVINPSTEVLPPFFYYSNIEQHDAVLDSAPEKLTFNSTLFDDSAVAPSEHFQDHYQASVINTDKLEGITGDESSPFQVIVSLKNDFSSLDQIKDIEIVKSDEYRKLDGIQKINSMSDSRKEKNAAKSTNYPKINSLLRTKNIDIIPRPFSFGQLKTIKIIDAMGDHNKSETDLSEYSTAATTIKYNLSKSDEINSHQFSLLNDTATTISESPNVRSEKSKILRQLIHTYGQPMYKSHTQAISNLSSQDRLTDFQSGESIRREVLIEESNKNKKISESNAEEVKEILVETELVPSLGFSLDIEDEREQYVDAVLRGLFKDITMPKIETKSSENVTEGNNNNVMNRDVLNCLNEQSVSRVDISLCIKEDIVQMDLSTTPRRGQDGVVDMHKTSSLRVAKSVFSIRSLVDVEDADLPGNNNDRCGKE
ncbi:hypothetical protein PV325_011003 [Microctonus aethiopoides]|nr:hypothetical protein PV325_011003 [Microctonus aethiopoides]